MDPLKIDHVLTKILTYLSHPIDLKNCRLVDQNWNLMATSVLNDRGATCTVSDENYLEFFENRSKNIAGLNLTLNLTSQPSGRSLALLAMTKELQQDKAKTGTGSYCVKSIKYCPGIGYASESLDEGKFWSLVEATAPDLEHLLVGGALKPNHSRASRSENTPAPTSQFPVLKSIIFDVRCHLHQNFIPRKLAEVLNNSPELEEFKLFKSDQRARFQWDTAETQLEFIPTEQNPANIDRIAGQLKSFGFSVDSGPGMFPLQGMTLDAVNQTKFQNIQKIAVLQFHNHTARPEFAKFLTANANTLTTLEYNYIHAVCRTATPLTYPPMLPGVKQLGLFYRSIFTQQEVEGQLPLTIRNGITHEHQGLFLEMLLYFQLTCRLCPNLETLTTDMNVCQGIAIVNMEEWMNRGHPENSNRETNEGGPVTTLEVTVPNDMIHFVFEHPGIFGVRLSRYFPSFFPLLRKLIVKVEMWPHNETGLRLPGILNIPGITDLEIVEYCQDWIGQELEKGTGSLSNLQQGLRRLRLRLSATQIQLQRKPGYEALSKPQRKKFKRKCLDWPEGVLRLCGAFQALEEVVIDRRVCWNNGPVPVPPGITITDKGVKITVL